MTGPPTGSVPGGQHPWRDWTARHRMGWGPTPGSPGRGGVWREGRWTGNWAGRAHSGAGGPKAPTTGVVIKGDGWTLSSEREATGRRRALGGGGRVHEAGGAPAAPSQQKQGREPALARIHFERRPAPAEPTRRSPGRAERAALAAAAVVQRVSVLDAEAAVTLAAGHRQHLLPPAAASGAPVPKHLLVPPGARLTPSVHVRTNHGVGQLPLSHWDWAVTKWADWDLDVLLVGQGTVVCSAGKMVFAEILFTRVTSQRKKI